MEDPDFLFIKALKQGKQNFVITDPHLPDNPIIYASQGFLDITGYSLDQVSRSPPKTKTLKASIVWCPLFDQMSSLSLSLGARSELPLHPGPPDGPGRGGQDAQGH